MKRVILESPYAGDTERNIKYSRRAMRDSLIRGEAPFASHLLYTQESILNDDIETERLLGIHAGFEWRNVSEATIVYEDYGISKGMEYGIKHAIETNHPIEYRRIGENPDD